MSKPILITGGAGFIGSNLIDRVLCLGKRVVCVDNFDVFYDKKVKESNLSVAMLSPNFTLEKGDIRDTVFIENVIKKHSVELVVHLAAKAGVRPSILDPTGYFDVNVNGTLAILKAMNVCGIKNLVFASSSSVYGNNVKIPYSETDNVDFPISPYASSKKCGELLTHTYHHLYQINVINLRFFTVYGPRQRPDLAIHTFFKKIYNNQPIDFFGDGNTSRDYTYIEDIVSGIQNAIEYIQNHNSIYEIINLGNHSPVKLKELIEMIEEVTGKKFIIEKFPMQAGDVNMTFADITHAKALLNYQPKTSLRDGLLQFKKWYEQNP